jgi:hypothetical protein
VFAPDEARSLGAVHELDRAVMAEEELLGDVTDGRVVGSRMPTHGEQQLMLHR